MTSENTLQLAQAVSSRSHTTETPLACGKTLHIGFFFDGFGRNLEDDLKVNRVSNIGRLFLAHMDPEDDSALEVFRAVYLSGLGAAFDTSLGTQAGGSLNRAASEVSSIPTGVAGNQAFQAVKDTLGGRSWWQRLTRDLSSLVDKPLKALQVLKATLVNTAAEAIEPIRDSRWSAHFLKTGVDTRLEGALSAFNREITDLNASSTKLRTIKVSVFGFDFGATLARAFIYTLFERSLLRDDHYFYRNARLEIVFAGLFDAVDRTAANVPPLEFFLPTTNIIGDGGLIHSEVKSVLHLVAAHERRFYRRVRLLGDARRHWREELMPGVSEDIGGGLAPGEQKLSNELALVSLHRMYHAALSAGAALPSFQGLEITDPETAELFIFNDRTPDKHGALGLARRYQDLVGQKTPSHQAFIQHMRYYIRWLAHIWRAYQAELTELAHQEDALYNSQFSTTSALSRLFRINAESEAQRQRRIPHTHEIHKRRTQLREELRWLHDVDKEARTIRTRLRVDGNRAVTHNQTREVWDVLLSEWESPQALSPETAELFSFFVHDLQVQSAAHRTGTSLLGGKNFFAVRGFDQPRGKQSKSKQSQTTVC